MDRKRIAVLVLVVLLLAAGGYWGYQNYLHIDISAIEATGTIEANMVQVSAKTQGTLKSVMVDEGAEVSQGELVAEISRHDLWAQRERDALAVSKAEFNLADLQSGAREQEIKEAALAADTAGLNHQQIAADYERVDFLYQAGAVPQAEYESMGNKLKLAENQLEAARARLSLLESGNRPQLINAARTEVERSKTVLKAAEAVLEDLKITAPLTGVVLSKNYQTGEYVNPGTPVITIADLSDMWIRVYIPTGDLPRVKLGQEVTFTVSGMSKVFSGQVEEIATKGEFTPKTIQTKQERANLVFGIKIRVEDRGGILKPGMPADVVFGEIS